MMQRRSERIATTAVFLANGIGIGAWAVAIPAIKSTLALSNALLGIALLGFALGALLAMQLASRFARHWGSGRATLLAACAFGVLLLTPALAWNVTSLFVILLVLGGCNGATDVLMNAHASAIERAGQRPIMSSFHAAWSIGGLIGAALGGAAAARQLSSLESLGMAAAIILGLVGAAALLGLRAGGTPAAAADQRLALVYRSLLRIGCVAFLCMLTEGAVADWSAVYLRTVTHSSSARAASGYGAFALAMAVCRLLGDQLVRRLGSTLTMALGGTLAAAGFALIVLDPHALVSAVGFVLIGIGLANVVPVLFTTAARYGASPAVGVSAAASAGYAGFLAGPPIIGLLAQVAGLRVAFVLLIGASLIVSFLGAQAAADAA